MICNRSKRRADMVLNEKGDRGRAITLIDTEVLFHRWTVFELQRTSYEYAL